MVFNDSTGLFWNKVIIQKNDYKQIWLIVTKKL